MPCPNRKPLITVKWCPNSRLWKKPAPRPLRSTASSWTMRCTSGPGGFWIWQNSIRSQYGFFVQRGPGNSARSYQGVARRRVHAEYAERCDNDATPPREAYQALAKHGWFGLILPAEYGGTGGSAIDLAILLEEAGRHFEELAMWLFRTLTYGGYAVMKHGTRRSRTPCFPHVARGELSFCFGLTEPESGSDAASLATRAMRRGRICHQRAEDFHFRHGHQRLLLLVTRTSTARRNSKASPISSWTRNSGYRGAQNQDARPARDEVPRRFSIPT